MDIDESLKIAIAVANEARPIKPVSSTDAPATVEFNDSRQQEPNALTASSVTESLKLVHAIAGGYDPYTSDLTSRHKPENNPDTVKALCIAVSSLAEQMGLKSRLAVAPVISENRGTLSLDDYLRQIEHREILDALKIAKYNKTEAARVLGITFRSLRYKLQQHGIE